uniref:Uncharacterized protein n=1 Tax=Rhizophora mucronata TaxID=61149 RepID=A0A2P2J456_RHIMU
MNSNTTLCKTFLGCQGNDYATLDLFFSFHIYWFEIQCSTFCVFDLAWAHGRWMCDCMRRRERY